MHSDSVNLKNYHNILEKIFVNIEIILQNVLKNISLIDAANNFDTFLLRYSKIN